MTNSEMIIARERIFNMLGMLGIILMLFQAFVFQILLHELPCPLCLLQRVGFLGVAFGFLLNLRFGLRPSHYAIVLLSALFTAFVALRQVALHIIPGSGVYGDAIFGIHLYTWSFIIAMMVVVGTTFMLGIDRQYQKEAHTKHMHWPIATYTLYAVFILLVFSNLVSVILECGLQQCPDNPVQYKLLGVNI